MSADDTPKQGGKRPGSGRKPKTPGEPMKTRPVRMTDQQWEDLKLVTVDAMRVWVTNMARKLRGKPTTKDET